MMSNVKYGENELAQRLRESDEKLAQLDTRCMGTYEILLHGNLSSKDGYDYGLDISEGRYKQNVENSSFLAALRNLNFINIIREIADRSGDMVMTVTVSHCTEVEREWGEDYWLGRKINVHIDRRPL